MVLTWILQTGKRLKKQKANAALLVAFKALPNCVKVEDLFDDTLQVSACIESLDDKSERGSLSQTEKPKHCLGNRFLPQHKWQDQKSLLHN